MRAGMGFSVRLISHVSQFCKGPHEQHSSYILGYHNTKAIMNLYHAIKYFKDIVSHYNKAY